MKITYNSPKYLYWEFFEGDVVGSMVGRWRWDKEDKLIEMSINDNWYVIDRDVIGVKRHPTLDTLIITTAPERNDK